MTQTSNDLVNSYLLTKLLELVALIGIIAAVRFWRKWSLGRILRAPLPLADSENSSEILAYYSAGQTLTNAGRGQLNGIRFTSYVSAPITPSESSIADGVAAGLAGRFGRFGGRSNSRPDRPLSYVNSVAAIFVLDLPFNTQAHLLGLSKEHKIDRFQFENFLFANGLVRVELEGDFGDYFDIYAAKGQEVQVRVVLNPESMEFVVDYCRAHFWEINASELYIVASESDKGSDDIIRDSQRFVEQIKPALLPGDPGAAPVHHETPYGEYDGPQLPCPICQQKMTITDNYHLCPAGHGALIGGRDLIRLRQHDLMMAADPSKAQKHGALTCPNCRHQMEAVDYEESGEIIDSCPNCPYRWLDADDIARLSPKPDGASNSIAIQK